LDLCLLALAAPTRFLVVDTCLLSFPHPQCFLLHRCSWDYLIMGMDGSAYIRIVRQRVSCVLANATIK
jgi:hypothetical protein